MRNPLLFIMWHFEIDSVFITSFPKEHFFVTEIPYLFLVSVHSQVIFFFKKSVFSPFYFSIHPFELGICH